MSTINDFDLSGDNRKNYDHIFTDSLRIINEREKGGKHSNFYHGNFIPQIPNQLIQRFTKKGDFVLDPFLGSGTTAIECEQLGRHIIGIDIQESLIERAKTLIDKKIKKHFITGNAVNEGVYEEIRSYLKTEGKEFVDLVLLHPPYFDIVQFSKEKADLSNAGSLDEFLEMFKKVIQHSASLLKKGGYMGMVIGDKYQNSERIPLGFLCMQQAQQVGLKLKSIIVKNMEGNRGKLGVGGIWRYRALSSDYYIFKHEYILIFKK